MDIFCPLEDGAKQEVGVNRKSSSSRSTMDELSIDSTSNEKVRKSSKASKASSREVKSKMHFKIEWRQLTYYQRPSSLFSRLGTNSKRPPRRILNSLDGCFRSGELSAILGPSGAGKSTFISALFGAKQEAAFGETRVSWLHEQQQQVGDGAVAGGNLHFPLSAKKRRPLRIASLPQHDHLLNHLTVYETLMFASRIKNAKLKWSSSGDLPERQQVHSRAGKSKRDRDFHKVNVRRVAKMLKLSDCLDTRCNKLSGGQHKRVSIGQELLSEPDVIILDEPTSGLDAMTCLSTVQTLKSIVSKHPMSIILTIHQPDMDVFNLFDHVYVIAQGGLAIYEGPPGGILGTLASVGVIAPCENYNPARLIVETAFFSPGQDHHHHHLHHPGEALVMSTKKLPSIKEQVRGDSPSLSSDEDETGELDEDEDEMSASSASYIRRSMLSLSGVISGKEMVSGQKDRKRDQKPLLNIAIKTLEGQLITSENLQVRDRQTKQLDLLKKLNELQKTPYKQRSATTNTTVDHFSLLEKKQVTRSPSDQDSCYVSCEVNNSTQSTRNQSQFPLLAASISGSARSPGGSSGSSGTYQQHEDGQVSSVKSDYSSLEGTRSEEATGKQQNHLQLSPPTVQRALSLTQIDATIGSDLDDCKVESEGERGIARKQSLACSLQILTSNRPAIVRGGHHQVAEATNSYLIDEEQEDTKNDIDSSEKNRFRATPEIRLRRQFDKRLSAKHNCSLRKDNPIWCHAFLLAHRTWLSIVRDPIFFGIQACMHTVIPILLASIFGSVQEEGCPRIGHFDLVDFAYSDSDNMIQGTVSSIRQSIGNIGIVFFEMFVLSFSINCITALVFPQDMYVLLKEYRNGWYSMRSYFFGRTIADLPVPIALHSFAMLILYYLTGQPQSLWRFSAIITLVILASLVAQSVGLTIGALLMKSSQSAVLAAAGIVAPFFALSGFIVRIHTLPSLAQAAAKVSYLYHLLNGFIILRYGFGRCQCQADDFQANDSHQIPGQLHTLASMWIGTYSNEYPSSQAGPLNQNRTNQDPNIDVVDKMMNAFKMANSYGHQITTCDDVLPYAMLDFNLRDDDIYTCFIVMIIMLIVSRFITFTAIYYKIRSFA